MGLFFGRRKNEEELPEDFVLYNEDDFDDEEDYENYTYEEAYDMLQDTAKIDVSEVEAMLGEEYDEDEDEDEDEEVEYGFFGALLHNRVFMIVAGCVLAALILGFAAMGVVNYLNPLRNYAQALASKENVLRTMDVEGTLESGNKYNITSLVSGKIITSKFEVGDKVKAGDVIYKIDDTEAKLSLERAKNELERASDPKSGNENASARIIATEAGVIKSLSIKAGSSVTAGSPIGTVLKSDGTVAPLISYVSGKVSVLSVNVGRSVTIGQVIASLGPVDVSETDAKYNKKAGEIDVQAAQRHLENYSIKSPVTGVIAEKYSRVGDNIGITDSDHPMMVIIDTSALTFKFRVDEVKSRELKKGLEVVITSESLPEETFLGKVSYVSTEGILGDDGSLLYEAAVEIDEPGNLRAGMKVQAKVVLASAKKVVAVPEKALLKSDGKEALVLVKNDEFSENADDLIEESLENSLEHPEIKIPKGCSLLKVRYGISDGLITEIKSGIKVGDVIVYDPEAENNFVVASGKTETKKSSEEDDSGRVLGGEGENDGLADRERANEKIDEKLKAAIGEDLGNDMEEGLTDYVVVE